MRRSALTAMVLLLAACVPREPPPAVVTALEEFDAQFVAAEAVVGKLKTRFGTELADFRDRTLAQDLDEWVLSRARREEIRDLREAAAESDSEFHALNKLARARTLLEDAARAVPPIVAYWTTHRPAPYWRRYWTSLYRANRVEAEAPDSKLVSIEEDLKASLANGDFAAAGRDADLLNSVLSESLDRAALRILKIRTSRAEFAPRRTPCVPGAEADRAARRVRLHGGEALERFYPSEATKRGESGTVILRARVDAKGCGTSVAIVVRSGVESLDAAALQWFETAQFSAKWAAGGPTAAEMTFKVKFILKDSS